MGQDPGCQWVRMDQVSLHVRVFFPPPQPLPVALQTKPQPYQGHRFLELLLGTRQAWKGQRRETVAGSAGSGEAQLCVEDAG